jgi:hypothetical protein
LLSNKCRVAPISHLSKFDDRRTRLSASANTVNVLNPAMIWNAVLKGNEVKVRRVIFLLMEQDCVGLSHCISSARRLRRLIMGLLYSGSHVNPPRRADPCPKTYFRGADANPQQLGGGGARQRVGISGCISNAMLPVIRLRFAWWAKCFTCWAPCEQPTYPSLAVSGFT